MIYPRWTSILTYLIIIIDTIVTISLDNRQPSKTTAWLPVFIFLPIVGIILYFFFGQNACKQYMMSQQNADQLTKRSILEFAEQKDLVLPKRYQPLIQLFANQDISLLLKDNEVEIYTGEADFFLGLLKAIDSAKHHIYVDTCIIEGDPSLQLIADALINRAREGIEVRLIYNYAGCWKALGRYFKRLRNVSIDVRSFMPVHFLALTDKVNYRDHHKLAVVDGQIGFIGDTNITMYCIRGPARQPWRDTHIKVHGGVVYTI